MTETYCRGTRGRHVQKLQEALIDLRYPLPKFGADGSLGNETVRALELYVVDHTPDFGGSEIIPGDELEDSDLKAVAESVLSVAKATRRNRMLKDSSPGFVLERGQFANTPGPLVRGVRSWNTIDSIVLHQTGTTKGLPNNVRLWSHVPIHVGIPSPAQAAPGQNIVDATPRIYLLNMFQGLLWHAQGLSRRSVGIEVNGNFHGIEGRPSTHWKPGGGPSILGREQILATRSAIELIIGKVAANGGKIRHIFAHRQSSKHRPIDPGQAIWSECGAWAIEHHGLSSGVEGFTVGNGLPLPPEWS